METTSTKVFGIGWAKTGTTTLGRCLELLGYRHMGQRLDLVPHLATGDLAAIVAAATEADAFEDWPWLLLFRELDAAFPGSRFVFTTRAPDRWIRSYLNMLRHPVFVSDELTRIRRVLYGLPFPDVTAEQLLDRYQRHHDAVYEHFRDRPDDLLVVDWEAGAGWSELCGFLGHEVPGLPLPRENVGNYGSSPPPS
jgi:hypothetical protein